MAGPARPTPRAAGLDFWNSLAATTTSRPATQEALPAASLPRQSSRGLKRGTSELDGDGSTSEGAPGGGSHADSTVERARKLQVGARLSIALCT